jgi:hypothetical protein
MNIIKEEPNLQTVTQFLENSKEVKQFYENSIEIENLEAQLKELKKENEAFKKEIEPYIETLTALNLRTAETNEYILNIKKVASTRLTVSYEKALKYAFKMLDAEQQRLIDDFLTTTAKLTDISASFEIKLKEGIIDDLKATLGKYLNIIIKRANKYSKNIISNLEEIEKILEKTKTTK